MYDYLDLAVIDRAKTSAVLNEGRCTQAKTGEAVNGIMSVIAEKVLKCVFHAAAALLSLRCFLGSLEVLDFTKSATLAWKST